MRILVWQISPQTIILTNIFSHMFAEIWTNFVYLQFWVFSTRIDFSFCGILQLGAFPPPQHYMILTIWLKFSPLELVDFAGQKGNWYLRISIPHNVLILCGILHHNVVPNAHWTSSQILRDPWRQNQSWPLHTWKPLKNKAKIVFWKNS